MDFFVAYIAPLVVWLPMITGFVNLRYLPKEFKVLLGFLVYNCVMDYTSIALAYMGHYTIFMFNLYALLEFVFLSWYFLPSFTKPRQIYVKVFAGAFVVFGIVNMLFLQTGELQFNTYTRALASVTLIFYAMHSFYNQSQIEDTEWGAIPHNWVNTGILLYYASNLFMFLFTTTLLSAGQLINDIVWTAHDAILMFEYILFAIGFYKCRKIWKASTY